LHRSLPENRKEIDLDYRLPFEFRLPYYSGRKAGKIFVWMINYNHNSDFHLSVAEMHKKIIRILNYKYNKDFDINLTEMQEGNILS